MKTLIEILNRTKNDLNETVYRVDPTKTEVFDVGTDEKKISNGISRYDVLKVTKLATQKIRLHRCTHDEPDAKRTNGCLILLLE